MKNETVKEPTYNQNNNGWKIEAIFQAASQGVDCSANKYANEYKPEKPRVYCFINFAVEF